ncbi:MAG: hypothetical protein VKK42_04480 [Lyngbya sp.]|nr:hypothetical protein [Lyngbya sp.]
MVNNKVIQLALKISLLEVEYSQDEIALAIELLEENNLPSELLSYLGKNLPLSQSNKTVKKSTKTASSKKGIDKNKLKSLTELENRDPDKYQILLDFCDSVLMEEALPSLSEMRRLGNFLSNNFSPAKTKQATLDIIIQLLAERSLEEIKAIINDTISSHKNKSNSYLNLATYLIEGKRNDRNTERDDY